MDGGTRFLFMRCDWLTAESPSCRRFYSVLLLVKDVVSVRNVPYAGGTPPQGDRGTRSRHLVIMFAARDM